MSLSSFADLFRVYVLPNQNPVSPQNTQVPAPLALTPTALTPAQVPPTICDNFAWAIIRAIDRTWIVETAKMFPAINSIPPQFYLSTRNQQNQYPHELQFTIRVFAQEICQQIGLPSRAVITQISPDERHYSLTITPQTENLQAIAPVYIMPDREVLSLDGITLHTSSIHPRGDVQA